MRRYRYAPMEDITAYEVAYIMGRVTFNPMVALGQTTLSEFPDDFPNEMKRHFIVVDFYE